MTTKEQCNILTFQLIMIDKKLDRYNTDDRFKLRDRLEVEKQKIMQELDKINRRFKLRMV